MLWTAEMTYFDTSKLLPIFLLPFLDLEFLNSSAVKMANRNESASSSARVRGETHWASTHPVKISRQTNP